MSSPGLYPPWPELFKTFWGVVKECLLVWNMFKLGHGMENLRRGSNRNRPFLHVATRGQDWVYEFGYVQILAGHMNFPLSISFSLCMYTHALTCMLYLHIHNKHRHILYRHKHWIQHMYIVYTLYLQVIAFILPISIYIHIYIIYIYILLYIPVIVFCKYWFIWVYTEFPLLHHTWYARFIFCL